MSVSTSATIVSPDGSDRDFPFAVRVTALTLPITLGVGWNACLPPHGKHFSPLLSLPGNSARLDAGMLFIENGKEYWGADAVHRLALLSTSSTLFNRINRAIFRRSLPTRLLYPLLKLGRRLCNDLVITLYRTFRDLGLVRSSFFFGKAALLA